MMKKTKYFSFKLFNILLAVIIGVCTFSLSGCGGIISDDDQQLDTSKTQLYIGNFKGGYGESWLRKVGARFEKYIGDESFEPSKNGVQVWIDDLNKDVVMGPALLKTISNDRQDVYFTESVYYYDFVSSNKLLDITDIVTTKLEKFGETRSIEDKMSVSQKDYFKTNDAKYFALPFYEAYDGITYDVDMFEDELLYFAKNLDNGNDGFITALDDEMSKGPDNTAGTFDDGLPATYDDFFKLCDRMLSIGVDPIIWSGMYQSELNKFLAALQTDDEGAEQMLLNVNIAGTAKNLVKEVDANGNITMEDPLEINNSNGYKLQRQLGKYNALRFMERLVKPKAYYTPLSITESQTHVDAQESYLYGRPSNKLQDIAMIVDGSWWENEAKGIFDSMVNEGYGEEASRMSRKFAFMPYPKSSVQKLNSPLTLLDCNYSACFINGNVPENKKDLAKRFLQFTLTDESLEEFSIETNTPKPYKYDVSEAGKAKMSNFGKSLLDLHNSAEVIYPASKSRVYISAIDYFVPSSNFSSVCGGGTQTIPVNAFRKQNIPLNEYFDGVSEFFSKEKWDTKFSKLF